MVKVDRIRFSKKGIKSVLSPLESDILDILWRKRSARVRDLYGLLKRRGTALTSVAVSLDRLHKKGIVSRKIEYGRGGPHYIYTCDTGMEEFKKSVVENVVDGLIENFGPSAVTYFNERFGRKGKR